MRQHALGEGLRLLLPADEHLRLPQGKATERLLDGYFRGNTRFHRLQEQRHGIGDAPDLGVRRPQGCRQPGEISGEVRVLTDAHGPFEQG